MAGKRNQGNRRPGAGEAVSGLDALVARLAKEHLDIDTLETRKSDSLDFHDVAVWEVKAALRAAYAAGRGSSRPRRRPRSEPPSAN